MHGDLEFGGRQANENGEEMVALFTVSYYLAIVVTDDFFLPESVVSCFFSLFI